MGVLIEHAIVVRQTGMIPPSSGTATVYGNDIL